VSKGKNVVTLPRKPKGSLRSGSYKVKLQLVDAAGNKSPTRTLTFKLSSRSARSASARSVQAAEAALSPLSGVRSLWAVVAE
jgi:hypothetical protein